MEVADPAIHMPDLSSAARVTPSFRFGRFEENRGEADPKTGIEK
ncbi:hypothetical protein NC651_002306 [Populus alba x Populus x berolinensis]|nr:hypothetical protein NC651_002306 [Populus alba x Populus x berolinensis]